MIRGDSLRSRLLSVLAALLLVAFTALGAAQYDALRRAILEEVDRTLLIRAQTLVGEIGLMGLDARSLQDLRLAEPLERSDAPEVFVQVLNARRQVVAASENVARLQLPLPPQVNQPTYYDISLGVAHPLRVMAAPVLSGDRPLGLVVVGESLRLTMGSLRQSAWRMLVVGAIALVATLAFASQLLRRGLEPLQRVADTAEEIVRTGDMSRRAPVGQRASEVQKVADAFNAVVARVEQQLDAQRRLLADTSHELGNPLTVLRTDLDLLRRDLDPETRAETVAEAEKEAERMARLVEELLQLSSAEVAMPNLELADVDLVTVANDGLARARALAGQRTLRLESQSGVVARGERHRLDRVLTNLLDNAIRHTAADGEIVVSVESVAGRARMAVRDNGVGIAAEHLPHVFERFYRVDRARSRSSGGTGLGLAIARMIASAHNGTLTVVSTPGKGTTFTLELPAAGAFAPA